MERSKRRNHLKAPGKSSVYPLLVTRIPVISRGILISSERRSRAASSSTGRTHQMLRDRVEWIVLEDQQMPSVNRRSLEPRSGMMPRRHSERSS